MRERSLTVNELDRDFAQSRDDTTVQDRQIIAKYLSESALSANREVLRRRLPCAMLESSCSRPCSSRTGLDLSHRVPLSSRRLIRSLSSHTLRSLIPRRRKR